LDQRIHDLNGAAFDTYDSDTVLTFVVGLCVDHLASVQNYRRGSDHHPSIELHQVAARILYESLVTDAGRWGLPTPPASSTP
ncbi:MAG: hypothetical protein QGG40_08610, partial [Myxococcota bacterium]|nr:hypothetical protein [Myxococcota bacterium]